ncbi:MAG: serine hydrolase [Cyclobacteriaceae bacterium]
MAKKVLKWAIRVILLCFLLLGTFIALNFTRVQRALTYPTATEITSSEWYAPKGAVKGNNLSNYALANSLSINNVTLDDVSNYAEDHNSSALLVLHRGKLQLEQYWHGKTHESTTNSMSMAKAIVNTLIGIAIDEGTIKSEQEAAATYITEWANDDRNTIRIEDLMLMQSGLRNDNNTGDFFSDLVTMYFSDDVESTAVEIPIEIKPGTKYDYNNANTQILGILLERATGEELEEYASSRLWLPLGAADAGWWLDREGGMPKTFCCYFAQAEDWLLFGRLILQNGVWKGQRIIPEEWMEKMITPSPNKNTYGYHVAIYEADSSDGLKEGIPAFASKTYSLNGANNQHVFVVPEHDLVVVRLGERPNGWQRTYLVNKLVEFLEQQGKE